MQLVEYIQTGKVSRQDLGPDVQASGRYDENSIIDCIVYEVYIPYDQVEEYVANLIVEKF